MGRHLPVFQEPNLSPPDYERSTRRDDQGRYLCASTHASLQSSGRRRLGIAPSRPPRLADEVLGLPPARLGTWRRIRHRPHTSPFPRISRRRNALRPQPSSRLRRTPSPASSRSGAWPSLNGISSRPREGDLPTKSFPGPPVDASSASHRAYADVEKAKGSPQLHLGDHAEARRGGASSLDALTSLCTAGTAAADAEDHGSPSHGREGHFCKLNASSPSGVARDTSPRRDALAAKGPAKDSPRSPSASPHVPRLHPPKKR